MPGNNSMPADLKHRDWLLYTQQKLIQRNSSNLPGVTTKIIDTSDGGKRMIVSNISESAISIMEFLTNTDQNNNYLYLESTSVTLGSSITPLAIAGINNILVETYRLSDTNAYLSDSKTHIPFANNDFNGSTIGTVIDTITARLPFVENTSGIPKYFTLVLNPDRDCGNGYTYCPPEKSFTGTGGCHYTDNLKYTCPSLA